MKKKGLLISPEFPADTFWSAKHVMPWVGKENVFPPLGLLTFAAQMTEDWDLELVDMNVRKPRASALRQKIQKSDAVFVGAMNIQRNSLIELLRGPAQGTGAPWVLGGPMASTYRDTILNPQTEEDQILHDGLDFLVWGESAPWIPALNQKLEAHPVHDTGKPLLLIPERVAAEPSGSREYLRDKDIFQPLDQRVPRWDLIDVGDYRAMMLQTTAGCRFRCNFCDIVQFNGGFARAKEKTSVTRELQAIYDTGFRGGVFTVDDNFVSEPNAMEAILAGMIEFQREREYPFNFLTQASLDLGNEKHRRMMPLMRQAGFAAVFLGIENPDPTALKEMNKVQNIKTDPAEVIKLLNGSGIEVMAGFIFGCDSDSRESADAIVEFVREHAIVSAMTGKLTPMPHTPLYVELATQGRLYASGHAGNNMHDALEYDPIMGAETLQEGFRHIISSLFGTRKALYERIAEAIRKADAHIFTGNHMLKGERWAAAKSLWHQGRIWRIIPDLHYARVLARAWWKDVRTAKNARRDLKSLRRFWREACSSAGERIVLNDEVRERFARMLDYAHEAYVRFDARQSLLDVQLFADRARQSIRDGTLGREEAAKLYEGAALFLRERLNQMRFPGSYVKMFFRFSVIAHHYMTVAKNILTRERVLKNL